MWSDRCDTPAWKGLASNVSIGPIRHKGQFTPSGKLAIHRFLVNDPPTRPDDARAVWSNRLVRSWLSPKGDVNQLGESKDAAMTEVLHRGEPHVGIQVARAVAEQESSEDLTDQPAADRAEPDWN